MASSPLPAGWSTVPNVCTRLILGFENIYNFAQSSVTQEDVFGQEPAWENKPGARSDLSTCVTSTSMGGR